MKAAGIFFLTLFFFPLFGQPEAEKALFAQILMTDSLFFQSLNNCDLDTYASFLAEDFEFYHDKGGLNNSKEAEMQSMAAFCGEQRQRQQLNRQLIAGSVDVSPIKDFGAVQTGRHRFYIVLDDQHKKVIEEAKFVHVWQQQPAGWQLTRVISYDHQPVSEVELPDTVLDRYTGSYQVSTHDSVVITRDKKRLHAQQGDWSASLYPESENTFYLDYGNHQVVFIEGQKGNIVKMIIYESGNIVAEGAKKQ